MRLKALWMLDLTMMLDCCPGICDGAAAVMVASEEAVKEHNLTPLARCLCLLVVVLLHPLSIKLLGVERISGL